MIFDIYSFVLQFSNEHLICIYINFLYQLCNVILGIYCNITRIVCVIIKCGGFCGVLVILLHYCKNLTAIYFFLFMSFTNGDVYFDNTLYSCQSFPAYCICNASVALWNLKPDCRKTFNQELLRVWEWPDTSWDRLWVCPRPSAQRPKILQQSRTESYRVIGGIYFKSYTYLLETVFSA